MRLSAPCRRPTHIYTAPQFGHFTEANGTDYAPKACGRAPILSIGVEITDTPTPLDTAILVGVIVLLACSIIGPLVFWIIPQCGSNAHDVVPALPSVKISGTSLSPSEYEAAGSDRVYVGKHVW